MRQSQNQDLCMSLGQEGPNFCHVVQVVSDLGNCFDVLIEREGKIKGNTKVLDSCTLRNNAIVKSYGHLIKVVSLSSRGNYQHLSISSQTRIEYIWFTLG